MQQFKCNSPFYQYSMTQTHCTQKRIPCYTSVDEHIILMACNVTNTRCHILHTVEWLHRYESIKMLSFGLLLLLNYYFILIPLSLIFFNTDHAFIKLLFLNKIRMIYPYTNCLSQVWGSASQWCRLREPMSSDTMWQECMQEQSGNPWVTQSNS